MMFLLRNSPPKNWRIEFLQVVCAGGERAALMDFRHQRNGDQHETVMTEINSLITYLKSETDFIVV